MLPSLIARRWVGCRLYDGPDIKLFILVSCLGPGPFVCFLVHRGSTGVFFFFFFFFFFLDLSKLYGAQGSPSSGSLMNL